MKQLQTTSASLHIFAMACMLCDHLWGTVVAGRDWLTCVGRLAMPIFAFLLVEGYFHTSDIRKYAGRMALFALLSEIPFNLAIGGRLFFPIHQNILWSFLICLWLIHRNERAKATGKPWRRILTGATTIAMGSIAGLVTFVDYYHAGILTVLAFYFFRGRKWWNYAGQALCLWYLNTEVLGGLVYEFSVSGHIISFPQQGFALLALIPIWLYRGNQGHHSKTFRYLCYAFYPAHLLILGIIRFL